jgi:hypothetical protein
MWYLICNIIHSQLFYQCLFNYIDMCNSVAFTNRLLLYPCKLSWVIIKEQKLIALFIHLCTHHNNTYQVYFVTIVVNSVECLFVSVG